MSGVEESGVVGCSFCRMEVLSTTVSSESDSDRFVWDLRHGSILRYRFLSGLVQVYVPSCFLKLCVDSLGGSNVMDVCPVCGTSFRDVIGYRKDFFRQRGSCSNCKHCRFRHRGGTRVVHGMDRGSRDIGYVCSLDSSVISDVEGSYCSLYEKLSQDQSVFSVSLYNPFGDNMGVVDDLHLDSNFVVEWTDGMLGSHRVRCELYRCIARELVLRLDDIGREHLFQELSHLGVNLDSFV